MALDSARAAPGSIATLPAADIIPFSRSACVSVDHWLDQMEYRVKSLNMPPKHWVPDILAHVAPQVLSDMKKYFSDDAATSTAYEGFAAKRKEI